MHCVLLSPILFHFVFSVTNVGNAPPETKDLVGIWEGPLRVGSQELRLVFVVEEKEGKLISKMDSPDQGAKNLEVEKTKFEAGEVQFDLVKFKIRFAGKMSVDKKSIPGKFSQSGKDFPLDLKRVDKILEVRRPQTPKKPFPYKEVEVVIENKKTKDVKLAGTLTLPPEKGPFAAAILITGSGPQDRDETLLGHKPFAVIADFLTRKGIAVLRCDDRGVAKSTGKHSEATTADFVTDIEACFEYLKTRPELDPKKIGLIGHSEGGLIGPSVAAQNPDVAFVIMLAGPGVPGDEILLEQGDLIANAMGQAPDFRKVTRDLNIRLFQAIKAGQDEQALMKLVDEAFNALSEEDRKKVTEDFKKELQKGVKKLVSPWFRYFIKFDPRPTLQKVKCPVLALNGERDLQVSPKQNLPEIEKALKASGNPDVTCRSFPQLNHLFQKCQKGAPSEYAKIEETFSPEVLDVIGEWILKRTQP
ncbi:alpha/beta hydrolase [Telmatocola sphagniphila]|uniref:Alpha/beta hydrolase n=1 Tax=Telmatocola sphagniphila TaxID=1123043 RepID=A0A8E6EV67_9BACT|nr:alpha/beta hydrolase [Telmatocola sphagniphila]QVL34564.1 alpha/beta hydrolase [Telmatocola sphagniphila]